MARQKVVVLGGDVNDPLEHERAEMADLDVEFILVNPASEGEGDEALGRFYEALLASEARHHGVYLDLAAKLVSRAELEARLLELAAAEAEIVERPCEWVRLHAG